MGESARREGLKKTFNVLCCCDGLKIRVLRKKSSGRKMVKYKMTGRRRNGRDVERRKERRLKPRRRFQKKKKKKKSSNQKNVAKSYKVAVMLSSNFNPREIVP